MLLCKVFHMYLQVKKKTYYKAVHSETDSANSPTDGPYALSVRCRQHPSSLTVRLGLGMPGKRQAGTPLCLLHASLQLRGFHLSLCFPQQHPVFRSLLGTGSSGRKESLTVPHSMSLCRRHFTWRGCWPWACMVHSSA